MDEQQQQQTTRKIKGKSVKDSVANSLVNSTRPSKKTDSNARKSSSAPKKGQGAWRFQERTKKEKSQFLRLEQVRNRSDNNTSRQPQQFKKMLNALPKDLARAVKSFMDRYQLDELGCYYTLEPDLFVVNDGESLICTLCCTREPLKRPDATEAHIRHNQHMDKFLELRSSILQEFPSDDSIHGAATTLLFDSWIQENSLAENHRLIREKAIHDFSAVLSQVSPESKCKLIGSYLTGCSLADSDVNLELIHPNTKFFESDPRAKNSIHHKLVDPDAGYGFQINQHTLQFDMIENSVSTLFKVSQCIQKRYLNVDLFTVRSNLEDLNGKIPELCLVHEPTGVKLSICCHAETSYKLACLLRNYLSLDERVWRLCTLVKHWARLCQISNPKQGTLAPDTIIILIIHFLQRIQPPVLPCLHEIINKRNEQASQDTIESFAQNFAKLNMANQSSDNKNSKRRRNESGTEDAAETIPESEMCDEELEEDCDDDGICNEFDMSLIENLNWSSENGSSLRQLFIGFLKYFMSEFADLSRVISIRTLDDVPTRSKKWSLEVKAIENPIQPKMNLSRTIGCRRTYNYITQCFAYGYYYLSSIPAVTRTGKDLREPRTDPTNFSEIFVNLRKLEFYTNMKDESIRKNIRYDAISEMIRQDIFSKDIDTLEYFIGHLLTKRLNLENIYKAIFRSYDMKSLIPPDLHSTVFCWICRKVGHIRARCPDKRTDMKIPNHDEPIDSKMNFDDGFLDLYLNDMITEQVAKCHNMIVHELKEAIVKGTGLNCMLTLFGSTVNMLGSYDSDLDICMTIIGNETGKDLDCAAVLKDVSFALAEDSRIQNMEPILTARVPIIKFSYRGYDIDLSMYNQCAIHNSRLLRTYAMIDGKLPQLFYLVKRYAKACGIADASKGSLSSYAWSLMVIHFLQHTDPPLLPVLQESLEKKPKPMFGVNGWNVWFDDNLRNRPPQPYELGLTTLFKRFLAYYAKFDFNQQVISIRTSKTMSKFQKNWSNCLMAIEDPFELTYNLSGRLDEPMALYIIRSFSGAYRRVQKMQEMCLHQGVEPSIDRVKGIFVGNTIMSEPPPYRGCRFCHRIGHRVKDCPEKERKEATRQNRR